MSERSIILKPWEAKAFAAGRATALLRVMTPQPETLPQPMQTTTFIEQRISWGNSRRHVCATSESVLWENMCPFGAPGGVLLGRETWACDAEDGALIYRASEEGKDLDDQHSRGDLLRIKWRSSTSMPAWAVRTRLVIERVRVVRWRGLDDRDCEALCNAELPLNMSADTWCWLIETRRVEA